ncbi:predicted protein, partial [Nematostella vectensis]
MFAGYSSIEIAEMLLKHGAIVNARNTSYVTPLHIAVGNGRTRIAQLLIANGADLEAETNDGETALH